LTRANDAELFDVPSREPVIGAAAKSTIRKLVKGAAWAGVQMAPAPIKINQQKRGSVGRAKNRRQGWPVDRMFGNSGGSA
jgi:hypothetical protein